MMLCSQRRLVVESNQISLSSGLHRSTSVEYTHKLERKNTETEDPFYMMQSVHHSNQARLPCELQISSRQILRTGNVSVFRIFRKILHRKSSPLVAGHFA